MKTTCIGRRPQIFVWNIAATTMDHIQILNLSLDDQIIFLKILKMNTTSNRRRPSMEDNPNGRRPPIEDKLQWKTKPPMEEELQWKTTSIGRQPQMEDDI